MRYEIKIGIMRIMGVVGFVKEEKKKKEERKKKREKETKVRHDRVSVCFLKVCIKQENVGLAPRRRAT